MCYFSFRVRRDPFGLFGLILRPKVRPNETCLHYGIYTDQKTQKRNTLYAIRYTVTVRIVGFTETSASQRRLFIPLKIKTNNKG
jgi:hypothetical protein